jgi:hypothetical protein
MKTFCIDIDGTFAETEGNDYLHSQPKRDMINKINRLYNEGHTIKIFTGRGYTSGMNWREFTKIQLTNWGVRYHELIFGKPSCDYIVDNLVLSPDEFLNKEF